MTRWLQAAQAASLAGDKTDSTDRTLKTRAADHLSRPVSSVLSVSSDGCQGRSADRDMTWAATWADALHTFEERAAIRQSDCGQTRAEADRAALAETAAAFNIPPVLLMRRIRTGD
jgi:hypothetical protein